MVVDRRLLVLRFSFGALRAIAFSVATAFRAGAFAVSAGTAAAILFAHALAVSFDLFCGELAVFVCVHLRETFLIGDEVFFLGQSAVAIFVQALHQIVRAAAEATRVASPPVAARATGAFATTA